MNLSEQKELAHQWLVQSIQDDAFALPIEAQQFNIEDWATIFESLPNEDRMSLWRFIAEEDQGAILAAMTDDSRNQMMSLMDAKSFVRIVRSSNADQLIEIIDVIPEQMAQKIIKRLTPEDQETVESALEYEEDQLGRYINHDVYIVDGNSTVANALVELKNTPLPAYTDSLLVVDENDHYIGQVDISTLLKSPRNARISRLTQDEKIALQADMSLIDASKEVKNSGRSMLPVLKENELLGRFSIKDALDVYEEYFEDQMNKLGKVSDEDLFAPVGISAKRRAVWLGINLITAFMASFVIGIFEDVVAQVVALAVLMPIVASMGGIAGSQTLTLTIRGLATGTLNGGNISALGDKEFRVTFINGLLWGLAVAIVAGLWFGNPTLSMIIAMALLVNMLVASIGGIAIPVLLDRQGIDPALAGSVILTTITDVVGFFVFLGSAALLLV